MTLNVFVYDAETLTEHTLSSISELRSLRRDGAIMWVTAETMPSEDDLAMFADEFGVHPGALAQLVKPFPGGRIEQYGDYRLVSTRMFRLKGRRLEDEDMQLLFNRNLVLCVQGGLEGDCLDVVRKRLRNQAGHIREQTAEHLAIALVDAIIDSYFQLLDQLGTALDTLEDDILLRHDRSVPARIHSVKREISKLRHAVWPLRDSLNAYYRDVGDDLGKHTQVFLRDCTDNAVRVMEMLETQRELCSDLMDLHLSTASARMNEVMKVLTIITTLFIPPTFIAGIYGMNFKDSSPWNMPELAWTFGYPFALSLMFTMVVALVWFLYRRGCFKREVIDYRRRNSDEF